jgi:hypothetical protein
LKLPKLPKTLIDILTDDEIEAMFLQPRHSLWRALAGDPGLPPRYRRAARGAGRIDVGGRGPSRSAAVCGIEQRRPG